jgi:hypothetical protein
VFQVFQTNPPKRFTARGLRVTSTARPTSRETLETQGCVCQRPRGLTDIRKGPTITAVQSFLSKILASSRWDSDTTLRELVYRDGPGRIYWISASRVLVKVGVSV